MSNSREAFEVWYLKTHSYDQLPSVDAEFAWEAWQAAAKYTEQRLHPFQPD